MSAYNYRQNFPPMCMLKITTTIILYYLQLNKLLPSSMFLWQHHEVDYGK